MKNILSMSFLFFWLTATVVFAGPPQNSERIAIVGNTFADQLRTHGYLETRLLQSSANHPVSIRNLGWGGDMLTARDRPSNFPSEETTLTAHKTDVIIACFGMGESFAGEQRINEFQSDLREFIASHAGKKYNGKSAVRLILVSPIAYEDHGELTPARQQRNRELHAFSIAMSEVAAKAKVPFVDLFEPSLDLMNETMGPNLTTNGIHLNPYGYWAIHKTFFDQLVAIDQTSGHSPWQITLDAQATNAKARDVEVSKIESTDFTFSFWVTETSSPSLPPPTDQPLPHQLESSRDTLRVKNLKPGTYQLTIDEKLIATKTSDAFARGVPIDSSPAHLALEKFRAAVNDKNLQFTYSWKALNQVHIVGERKKSPSGKSLPREVIEFNKLAIQGDAALRNGIELKTRRWQLSRVKK